ncbi:MAG: 5-amino-6-(D-ribitylamino)uracil--L-tyrosine 4-hydroxyphenyl transferase CofH [Steroidobacteraceae bacterium]
MSCWSLTALKPRGLAKTRLAAGLAPDERRGLVDAMLAHVLDALGAASEVDRVAIVGCGHDGLPPNVIRLADPGGGLNQALTDAARQAAARGATRAVIIHADLPHLHSEEVTALIEASRASGVAIAPDHLGTGTNALCAPLPLPFELEFGPGSFARHLGQAATLGLQPAIIRLPGLAFDLDELEDLRSYEDAERLEHLEPAALLPRAEELTLAGFDRAVTYSRKVFIPLTQLCRDVCHYCTFAKAPRALATPYLTLEQALDIARAGAAAGCQEALFTLGDKPELRYAAARRFLASAGHETTLDYLAAVAREVHAQTGLLPHLNPGVMTRADVEKLRRVSVSMGLMLETASERLSARGGPHWGSPDKRPSERLATLEAAGEAAVPFTTGLLIGIGETRRERIEALLAIRSLHRRFGHIQEVIIQNFRAKPGTRMADAPEPPLKEHLWTIAVARLLLGPEMSIQAPPNLRPGALTALVRAGVNDWGGVSPVTPDHVNPEAPWPHLQSLAAQTRAAGRVLLERLAITPPHVREPDRWVDGSLRTAVVRRADSRGRARVDKWYAGAGDPVPESALEWLAAPAGSAAASPDVQRIIDRARRGEDPDEREVVALFNVDGADLSAVLRAADALREQTVGPTVTYVVNRNINYTNICLYHCGFCAFSKSGPRSLRGAAYLLDLEEVARRTAEAWDRGATEVCLQGGIHPSFTGQTYFNIVAAVKSAAADMHVHAFSPLEVTHGARTLGLSLETYLAKLRAAGLSTLPGTAAEILDDEVRAIICPDKLKTAEWLEVMRAAHSVGLRSTTTIMFGHVEQPRHWARHLLRLRALQQATRGFTEFVPLPFVHMEAPMWRKGLARQGPTFREAVLMHSVARLVLHPHITNIQASWVKMGADGVAFCLQAGANDFGGTLMNESITRAAGGINGQELTAEEMRERTAAIGRPLAQRTTLYGRVGSETPPPCAISDGGATRSGTPL